MGTRLSTIEMVECLTALSPLCASCSSLSLSDDDRDDDDDDDDEDDEDDDNDDDADGGDVFTLICAERFHLPCLLVSRQSGHEQDDRGAPLCRAAGAPVRADDGVAGAKTFATEMSEQEARSMFN
jgi:hypothetical protein